MVVVRKGRETRRGNGEERERRGEIEMVKEKKEEIDGERSDERN